MAQVAEQSLKPSTHIDAIMIQTTRKLSPGQWFKNQRSRRGRAYKGCLSFQSSVSKIHQVPPSTSSAVPLIGHLGAVTVSEYFVMFDFFSIIECIVRCRNYSSTKRPVTLLTAFSRFTFNKFQMIVAPDAIHVFVRTSSNVYETHNILLDWAQSHGSTLLLTEYLR